MSPMDAKIIECFRGLEFLLIFWLKKNRLPFVLVACLLCIIPLREQVSLDYSLFLIWMQYNISCFDISVIRVMLWARYNKLAPFIEISRPFPGKRKKYGWSLQLSAAIYTIVDPDLIVFCKCTKETSLLQL